MAKIYPLINFISKWEGGYVNDPSDPGGPTNKGITLTTWKRKGIDKNNDGKIDLSDLQLVTHQDMIEVVLRPHYWNPWQGDRINDQSVANIVVDWAWCSGSKTIPFVQWLLKVKPDGIVGPLTLKALNNYPNQEELFTMIKAERALNIRNLCKKRPELNRFKSGWLNRIADFKYLSLLMVVTLVVGMTSCLSRVKQPVDLGIVGTHIMHVEQAAVADEQHQHLAQADHARRSSTVDTMEESVQLAFSVPLQEQLMDLQQRVLAVQTQLPSLAAPLLMHGVATLHRIRNTHQADTSSTSSSLASALARTTSTLQQLYTADSLALTRRAQARRAFPFHTILPLLLLGVSFFLLALFYSKVQRWKSD